MLVRRVKVVSSCSEAACMLMRGKRMVSGCSETAGERCESGFKLQLACL